MSAESHIFAFFCSDIDTSRATRIHDQDLVHRLYRVVRVRPQDTIILFGVQRVLEVVVEDITSATLMFRIVKQHVIMPLQPPVNLWLPMLEKSAFEHALYAATVMGVHTIHLVVTAKGKRQSLSAIELERCRRIMIAAAEQSKQFSLPILRDPVPWEALPTPSQPIIADIDGAPIAHCIAKIDTTKACTIIIGPSGDFTAEEKQKLESLGMMKAKLVPTILRSEDAVMVSLGIIRSVLNA